MPRPTTKSTLGPGMTMRANAAAANVRRWSAAITPRTVATGIGPARVNYLTFVR